MSLITLLVLLLIVIVFEVFYLNESKYVNEDTAFF